jgi:hypothetical protein
MFYIDETRFETYEQACECLDNEFGYVDERLITNEPRGAYNDGTVQDS